MHLALGSVLTALVTLPMQLGGLLETQLGQAFVAVIALAVVVVVGRIVLNIAWRLVTIAALIIGALLLLSFFGMGI
ncbi:hypothetical protein C474_05330 [Halogeometricum pallidum JCM 14848]|uniref:Uncharacterized protein n=1 Tax=Halogeometricum pallidum JCM 14848 TaxID=1227487 RepID=M0DDD1_HALPD|nr:hypothetical protein [Halogeometricum pallidum]ELZ33476.1 hypothetical protein C474_05330 [Halogeometricum pallidum JCM 14848]